ncbi:MAG: protein translocase subunit SecD [Candidatus Binatia bacterium]
MGNLYARWLAIVSLVTLALLALYPSFEWYRHPSGDRGRDDGSRTVRTGVLNLGLDLTGGTQLLMEVETDKLPSDIDVPDAINRAIEVIRNRVDHFGIAEPHIARQGERWIVLQLPGVGDSAQAKALVGKTALLEFRIVDDSAAARAALPTILALGRPFENGKATSAAAAALPPGTLLLPGREESAYIVRAAVPLTGAALETARVETDEYSQPIVAFRFDREGGGVFDELTAANVGKQLAIVLDGVVYSAPVIRSRISGGSGIIEGNFEMKEARHLAIVLRAGALPAPVRIVEERTVGASLGEDSIRTGLTACAIGIGLVFVFFAAYYKLLGLFAVAALALNLLLLLAAMAYFGGTLTLPGIAGISLNVAMAVDANILILERIREELRRGKSMRQAIQAGYDLSASAIFDSNLTVLAASLLLFQFGTGPIKGFAITLTLGNLISMFTATVATRLMASTWLTVGVARKLRWHPLSIVRAGNIDWVGRRRWGFAVSGLVLAASLASVLVRGLNYGIDFTGGTLLEVAYAAPKSLADLRGDLVRAGYADAELQSFSGTNAFAIRVKGTETLDAQSIERLIATLQAADPANTIRVDRKEYVGPAVGRHLKHRAVVAIVLAIAAIIVYVAFRFKNPLWGAAGVAALLHDVLATVGLVSITQMEVDIVIVAAILTIAGYSINDTIVIFDRMRERQRSSTREPLSTAINASVNETLSRTLLTNGTVLAVVAVLYVFGGKVIHDFALVMIAGSLIGTYSTVAIATPLIFERQLHRGGAA